MKEELYNKIDKFCNETDWSKYPTYEHALEDFIKGIVAEETKELEKENAELKRENRGIKTCANCDEYVIGRCCNYPNGICHHWKLSEKYRNDDELTKAKEIIGELFHYIPSWTGKENDKPRVYAMPDELRAKAEQFIKDSEVEK